MIYTMIKKVNFPTQIIPTTTTHYQWRKALRDAEQGGRWNEYALLKAGYAAWRKKQRESRALDKLIRDQWMPKNWAKLDALTQGSN